MPPGPAISQVIWTAILSAAVVAALVTQGLQFLQNFIKRRAEVEDRSLKRKAEREDRIFEARREALVACLQAFSEANFWILTESAKPKNIGELIKKAKDASTELAVYTDDALGYQADRIFGLLVVAATTWDERYTETHQSRQQEIRKTQRAYFKQRFDRLRTLVRVELGVLEDGDAELARSESTREYEEYCELEKQASNSDRNVTYNSLTGAASLNAPTPLPEGIPDPEQVN